MTTKRTCKQPSQQPFPASKSRRHSSLSPGRRRSWLEARQARIIELRRDLVIANRALEKSTANVERLRKIANAINADAFELTRILLTKLSDSGVLIGGRADRIVRSLGVSGVTHTGHLNRLDSRQWVEFARGVVRVASELEDDFFQRCNNPLSAADAHALAELNS